MSTSTAYRPRLDPEAERKLRQAQEERQKLATQQARIAAARARHGRLVARAGELGLKAPDLVVGDAATAAAAKVEADVAEERVAALERTVQQTHEKRQRAARRRQVKALTASLPKPARDERPAPATAVTAQEVVARLAALPAGVTLPPAAEAALAELAQEAEAEDAAGRARLAAQLIDAAVAADEARQEARARLDQISRAAAELNATVLIARCDDELARIEALTAAGGGPETEAAVRTVLRGVEQEYYQVQQRHAQEEAAAEAEYCLNQFAQGLQAQGYTVVEAIEDTLVPGALLLRQGRGHHGLLLSAGEVDGLAELKSRFVRLTPDGVTPDWADELAREEAACAAQASVAANLAARGVTLEVADLVTPAEGLWLGEVNCGPLDTEMEHAETAAPARRLAVDREGQVRYG